MGKRALIIIDIQQDYFPGGRWPLEGPEAAAEKAGRVLEGFRNRGETVVHVCHGNPDPAAPFLVQGSPGAAIHRSVAPLPGESVVEKERPNAFLGTGLQELLRKEGVEELVICGMMSLMCVDATVRAAADLGYPVTLVHDGCAACPLEFGGVRVDAGQVHAAFMAALAMRYARLVSAGEF